MAYIELDDDHIVCQTEFVERELIKQVPGFTWDTQRKLWKGPASWGTCQTMRGVFGARLVVGPALVQWANDYYRDRVYPTLTIRELTSKPDDNVVTEALARWEANVKEGFSLYGHQRVDGEFLAWAQQALLANEMGTGKGPATAAAVGILDELGFQPFPACIIAPNSMKMVWADELARWYPGVETFVISSAKNKKKMFKEAELAVAAGKKVAVIINWEAVRLHSRLAPFGSVRLKRCAEHGGTETSITKCEVHPKELNFIPFRTVICDEAHKQKDPGSKQTRATWSVQHQAVFRFSLTGTPLANHPGDVWAIMHGLAPLDYPTKTRYVDRFCLMAWSAFGGLDIIGVRPDTRDEYFRILDPRMRRMPKALVLANLPPKTRARRYAAMNIKQAKAYKEIESGMVTRLDDGRLVVSTNNLTQQTRLLQFSSCYAEVNDEGHVRLTEPSSKIDTLLEVLEELGGKPVVVAAESRQLIELACARLDKERTTWRSVIGGQTNDQRDQALGDFMAGRARVLLFTIKAGGVGLTMTRADTIIFLQRSWSMLENKQAEDRVHRIGAEVHENITVIDLVAPGTVEEVQILRLYEKAERLEEIVRDKELLRNAATLGDQAASYRLAAIEAEEAAILASDLTGQDLLPALSLVPTEGTP